jgi:hypothetical protein
MSRQHCRRAVQHAGDNICNMSRQHCRRAVQHAGDNICNMSRQHCRRAVQHAADNICNMSRQHCRRAGQHAGDNICSVQHAWATHRSGTSDSTGCVLTARSATSSSQRWCDDSCAATHAHVHSRPRTRTHARARPPARPPAPICAAIAALSTSEGTPNRMDRSTHTDSCVPVHNALLAQVNASDPQRSTLRRARQGCACVRTLYKARTTFHGRLSTKFHPVGCAG